MPGRARDRARSRRGVSGSVLAEFDLTTQSAGAASLPSGLTFARASSGYTVQTGTSTLTTTGITSNNVARVGKLADAHSNGIFIEPARTNLAQRSREIATSPWLTGSTVATTADAAAGPDGASSADRSNVTSGGFSNYQPITTVNGTTYAFSTWIAARTSAQNHRVAFSETASAYTLVSTSSAPTTWQRVSGTRAATATTCYLVPCDGSNRTGTGGPAAMALDFFTDFAQVEAGGYATSAILTSGGSTATRAAEILTVNGAITSPVARQGRLGCYLRFRAIAARSALTAASEGNLFADADGDWYVWVNGSNGLVEIGKSDASKLSTSAANAITWSAGDLVEIAAQFGNSKSRLRYRINGGAATDVSFSAQDDTFGALAAANGIYVCSDGTTYHTPSVVEKITLFLPGRSVF